MAEDYMADAEEMTEDAESEEMSDTSETKTALLPKTFFGSKPLEVGSTCTVKVEKIMDDEVQVSYLEKEKEPEMPMEMPDAGMAEIMGDMA